MNRTRTHAGRVLLGAAVVLLAASGARGLPTAPAQPPAVELAEAGEAPPRPLEPRYQPVPPEEPSWYNASYIFGLTRGVAQSTMVPAVKAPLFVLTVPLDIVLLPFAAIGGLFG
jgi:hypothetical protein